MTEQRAGEPGRTARATAGGDTATKLAAARTRLILDRPFLGALVLRLPMVEAGPWCKTSATDMKSLYYCRDYIDGLSVSQVEFVMAHEALHCALSHFVRRGHRVRHKWDLACDHAINPILANDGLKPPPQAIVSDRFENMTAEEIYPCLDDALDEETMDQHLYDNPAEGAGQEPDGRRPPPGRRPPQTGRQGEGAPAQPRDAAQEGDSAPQGAAADAPAPLGAQEREQLVQKWRQYLAGAAQQAGRAGKLGGDVARMVDAWLAPKLPWRALLAHHVFDRARTDYNYVRPSRREGEMILPSLRGSHCDLVVALDTSGSITGHELAEFVAEINAIKGALQARITLLACDARLADDAPWVFEPWEQLGLPATLQGGGGTDFTPVFDWVDRAGLHPDALIYFTDGMGECPAAAPPYPVLWLVKGKQPMPWGLRVQLN